MISLLLRRGREERITLSAGGLTFTTVLSLVPLLVVSFAVFTRIPMLHGTGNAIREHLLRGLLPVDIVKAVLKHLAQFTHHASGLTMVGSLFLLLSVLGLLLSVENALNRIWQVKKARPLPRRLALYAVLVFMGPVLVGASWWATSSLGAAPRGTASLRPEWLQYAVALGPFVLGAAAFACLFRFVPHADVRMRDAIVGGLLAAAAFEFGKRGFAWYLATVPTYRTIYGAFAPLLAFLVWVYYSWLVTLAGALVSASLPRAGKQRTAGSRRGRQG
jgi:membrane protein